MEYELIGNFYLSASAKHAEWSRANNGEVWVCDIKDPSTGTASGYVQAVIYAANVPRDANEPSDYINWDNFVFE